MTGGTQSRANAGPERQLILCMSVSLDGFVARTDGVIDFLSSPSAGGVDHGDRRHRANLELLGQIGTIVIGRGSREHRSRTRFRRSSASGARTWSPSAAPASRTA
jgi:hypothetical protein